MSNSVQEISEIKLPNESTYKIKDAEARELIEELEGSVKQSDWTQSDSTSIDYIKNKPTYQAASGLKIYYNGQDVTNNTAMQATVAAAPSHWYGSQDSYNTLLDNNQIVATTVYHVLVQPDWEETDPSHLGYIKNKPDIMDMTVQNSTAKFFYK